MTTSCVDCERYRNMDLINQSYKQQLTVIAEYAQKYSRKLCTNLQQKVVLSNLSCFMEEGIADQSSGNLDIMLGRPAFD